MNERIKELADQAELTIHTSIGTYMSHPEFNKKFGELIVQECVGVVEGGRFLHDDAPTAIFARECSSAIKQHFGVE